MLQPRAGHSLAQSAFLDEVLFQPPDLPRGGMKPGRLGEFMAGRLFGLLVETALWAPTRAFVNGILVSMQLLDLFDLSLAGRASADALEYDRADGSVDRLTFGDLDARSGRVACLIASRGLARGDRLCF